MKRWDSVAIVGVGLIGGSIGLALRRRDLAAKIVGIGRTDDSILAAKQTGAIDEGTTDLAAGVADASLVIVCTPVESIVPHVMAAAKACPAGALLTDAGSTKENIVAGLDGQLPTAIRFVGSHPLAGSEKRGPEAARAELFDDRVAVVTPTASTAAADVEAVSDFWKSLGARVVRMTAAEHDRALAATSHLPHWVASALSAAVPQKFAELAAGGLLDTTRIAAGDPELWTQIFLANQDNLLAALDEFDAVAGKLRAALEHGDRAQLTRLLTQGKKNRDALGS